MPQKVRCEYCGEVIGVYEGLVLATDDEVRETSRAAEPNLPLESAAPYHRACYLERFGTAAASSTAAIDARAQWAETNGD